MKTIGLLVLTAGVALSASYGARLAPNVSTELATAKKAGVMGAAAKDAQTAYCKARVAEKLPNNAHCPSEADQKKAAKAATIKAAADKKAAKAKRDAKKAAAKSGEAPKKAAPKPAPDRAKLLAKAKAEFAALSKDSDATGKAAIAQDVWMAAEEALIDPKVEAALVKPTDPGERVSAWFNQSGIPFLGGLLLVVIGAIIGRKAVRAEATSDTGKKGAPAVDFAALLTQLAADLQAISDAMGPLPEAGQPDAVKTRIEALQFEAFEPIVEARGRIQARFGIASYAELFSPFSSAERRVNRSWSALVDNHWPEARDSMRIAALQMAETEVILQRLISAG
ncbi:MAG: hypothetical protein ACI9U2_003430 [Bradymonadia bacterium]|jgi:hypothetical protein